MNIFSAICTLEEDQLVVCTSLVVVKVEVVADIPSCSSIPLSRSSPTARRARLASSYTLLYFQIDWAEKERESESWRD